jgi:hypothetical protein
MKRFASSLVCLTVALAACGNGNGHSHPDADDFDCAATDADTYVVGLEKTGALGQIVVRLLESTPAPPSKDDNDWLVEIVSPTDAPLDDLEVSAVPFMPDHGHGTPKRTKISPAGEPGRYLIEEVNLWMPGIWEVTIEAKDGADLDDFVVYTFCIEG